MGVKTEISWTESTWNPVRGCSIVSPGCHNCYAMRVAARFSAKGEPYEGLAKFSSVKRLPQWTGKVRLVREHLADPMRWTRPRRVFVNSMSDLFHEALSNEDIGAVFGVMAASPKHSFQILTKRAMRMFEWFNWIKMKAIALREKHFNMTLAECTSELCWQLALKHVDMPTHGSSWSWPLTNVWLGVSAENQECANERIPKLLRTPAAVRFVSYEPALGLLDIAPWLGRRCRWDGPEPAHWLGSHFSASCANDEHQTDGLDWIIVGGESGPGARPFNVEWARSVVKEGKAANVAVFVKQLGAHVRTDGMQQPGEWWPKQDKMVDDGYGGFRKHLDDRKGANMKEWPQDLRVRAFPLQPKVQVA